MSVLRDGKIVLTLGARTACSVATSRFELSLLLLDWRVVLVLLGTFGSDCTDFAIPTDIAVLLATMSALDSEVDAGTWLLIVSKSIRALTATAGTADPPTGLPETVSVLDSEVDAGTWLPVVSGSIRLLTGTAYVDTKPAASLI